MVHKNIGVQHNHLNTSFLTKTNGEDRGWWKVEIYSAGIKGLYTYLIFVTGTTGVARVKNSVRCKFFSD